MSKPREKWWSYVKAMIRSYPELCEKYKSLHEPSMAINLTGMPSGHNPSSSVERYALREMGETEQREYDAVTKAIEKTKRIGGGKWRLQMIDLVYWKQTHTLEGASQKVHISLPTAKRWNGSFIYLVAECYGLDSKKMIPKSQKSMIS